MQLFISHYVNWQTGVMWSTSEDCISWLDSHSDGTHSLTCWRNKLIYILVGLRKSNFSANVQFWVNYYLKQSDWFVTISKWKLGCRSFDYCMFAIACCLFGAVVLIGWSGCDRRRIWFPCMNSCARALWIMETSETQCSTSRALRDLPSVSF